MAKQETKRLSKREEMRLKRRRQQMITRLVVIGIILLAIALIGFFGVLPAVEQQRSASATRTAMASLPIQIKPAEAIVHPNPNGTAAGDPNAPLRIDVYSDFQCSACMIYSTQIEPQVFETYVATGQVYYVYHHYIIIDDITPPDESAQSANGAMCAADQGKFWEYHDTIFANWNGENEGALRDDVQLKIAETIGLDMEKFTACFEDNTHEAQINADIASARALGMTSTPTILLNQEEVKPGFVPTFEEISAAIEAALNK